MGNPTLKNRVIPNSAIDKVLYDKLRELSKDTKVPISRLLDEAIEDLLIKRKARWFLVFFSISPSLIFV